MQYTVLSPWAEGQRKKPLPLSPRVEDLNGKTIGLYAHNKCNAILILQEVAAQLQKRYPTAKFSYFHYPHDQYDIRLDPDQSYYEKLKEWTKSVDTVITGYGDAGSCSLYHCYCVTVIEDMGVPTLTLVQDLYHTSARRGAAARGYANLRIFDVPMTPPRGIALKQTQDSDFSEKVRASSIRPFIAPLMDQIIERVTAPLTEEEANPSTPVDYANIKYTGTLGEIEKIFYGHGWTNGMPFTPPTEEAVAEMLTGTDLPRDYVVGYLPPMMGKATVEKIAINAVMAGCLPTYMPVLIAAVECMVDPKIRLEGWTCSNAIWMPTCFLSGSVVKDINANCKENLFSAYYKPNSTIPRAIAYILMNISGSRSKNEDMSHMGAIGRFGVCIPENEENNPWGPMHTDYGFEADDSVVTMFWPADHMVFVQEGDVVDILRAMCKIKAQGWANGCAMVLSPEIAKKLADAGWTRQRILDYVVEYNRIPSEEWNLGWLQGNNHMPEGVEIPAAGGFSARRFWDKQHMFIVVAGRAWASSLTGGGDHGGPAHAKIKFPQNWDALVEKYKDVVPKYLDY